MYPNQPIYLVHLDDLLETIINILHRNLRPNKYILRGMQIKVGELAEMLKNLARSNIEIIKVTDKTLFKFDDNIVDCVTLDFNTDIMSKLKEVLSESN